MEIIKLLLGAGAANFTDEQIEAMYRMAQIEVEAYCGRELDAELDVVAQKITIIKLQRLNTEGLASQSFSGVSENYINGYPTDIQAILKRKRKVKSL